MSAFSIVIVWQLSDLGCGTENKTVGFFLFGDTYKENWKMQVGTVFALLNPTIMKQDKVCITCLPPGYVEIDYIIYKQGDIMGV